jgi:hypothetical protein
MKTLVIVALSLLLGVGLMIVPSQAGGPLSLTDPVFTRFNCEDHAR